MQDQVIKTDKWEFDYEVTKCFDDMLIRSIPDYYTMRYLVGELGKKQITSPKDIIVDLGCSTGGSIAPFVETGNRIIGYEVSPSMYFECAERFRYYPQVTIEKRDIIDGFPKCDAKLIMAVLTIQFTPIEERWRILRNVYNGLSDGGCFILVEKVLASSAETDDLLTAVYYDMKRKNKYTEEQIQKKRESLSGVLVPVSERENVNFLHSVGFQKIECFWRCLNFAGWIAFKGGAE